MIEWVVPWLPDSIIGITLFPVILYLKGYRTTSLEVHEHYHWNQILRWGIIPWYVVYVVLWAVKYRNLPAEQHPLERPAYHAQYQWEADHAL